jgi:shikimate kinase
MAMALDRHLVLIGPMASGKSTVGQLFAARHGLQFVDSDKKIVAKHGSIPSIFSAQGERGFREIEAREVAALLTASGEPCVISLGGGAILDTGTQQLLANCRVVFLDADLETVLPRIRRDTGRPLLAGDAAARWTEMAERRRPTYLKLADLVLATRNKSQAELVEELSTLLNERQNS